VVQNGVGLRSIVRGAEPSVVKDGRTTEYGDSNFTCGFGASGIAFGATDGPRGTAVPGATGTPMAGGTTVVPHPFGVAAVP